MRPRQAFTIVEMMVSAALVLFIMVILSEAFTAGLESFRQLKAVGDMNDKLRTTTTILAQDLRAKHVGTATNPAVLISNPGGAITQGFFRVWQGSQPTAAGPFYVVEGSDANPNPISLNRATDHMLHFTVNLGAPPTADPERREAFFAALVPAGNYLATSCGPPAYRDLTANNLYNSAWAEVVYFLRPNGSSTPGDSTVSPARASVPLYALYRRQVVVEAVNTLLNSQGISGPRAPNYSEVSCNNGDPASSGGIYFNTPTDLTTPPRRFGMTIAPATAPGSDSRYAGVPSQTYTDASGKTVYTYPRLQDEGSPLAGADFLLTDVISFEVRVLFQNKPDFIDLFDTTLTQQNPFFNGSGPRVFDTWSTAVPPTSPYDYSGSNTSDVTAGDYKALPLTNTLEGIQITVRVWDRKTQRVRQVTLVQSL